ncbi:hypothetical protein LXA43DRAFT_851327, partial [Ganoderma leucocontextum]
LADLKISREFVRLLENATLSNSGLSEEALDRLRNPPQYPLDIKSPDVLLSIELFFATLNASDATYIKVREAYLRRHPENRLLSLYEVRQKVQELSGVVPIRHDQCIKSCIAF